MKQFNLKEYLANPNKKVITRDGRNVKIYCTNYSSERPIIAEIEGTKFSESFTEDGKFDNNNSTKDLFFTTEKHKGWINLYYDRGNYYSGDLVFNTENDAKENLEGSIYVTTIKIEWEE